MILTEKMTRGLDQGPEINYKLQQGMVVSLCLTNSLIKIQKIQVKYQNIIMDLGEKKTRGHFFTPHKINVSADLTRRVPGIPPEVIVRFCKRYVLSPRKIYGEDSQFHHRGKSENMSSLEKTTPQ
jgi:hypothetical protein